LPGVLTAREPAAAAPPLDPLFARQQLPRATEIAAPAVAPLAEAVYAAMAGAVDAAAGPFTVHAFTLAGADPTLGSRVRLVAREAVARLGERRRRSARRFLAADEAASRFAEVSLLV